MPGNSMWELSNGMVQRSLIRCRGCTAQDTATLFLSVLLWSGRLLDITSYVLGVPKQAFAVNPSRLLFPYIGVLYDLAQCCGCCRECTFSNSLLAVASSCMV